MTQKHFIDFVDSEVHMIRREQSNALLFFSLIHFIDLQRGKGEWNAAQLSHVTVAKE